VVNLTLSGASAGVGIEEAKTTREVFNSALSLANDIGSEGKTRHTRIPARWTDQVTTLKRM